MNKEIGIILSCLFVLAGCDIIDYHPYDVRIKGETDINAKNIKKIEEKCLDKTTFRFIAMGDSQRWYDETEDFVKVVNQRDDIDFVVHGGDMSDFGLVDEFMWQRDIMNKLNVPFVTLIGNHDCVGTGEESYRKIFGNTNFSFIAGRTKFVCLNTNAMEYDYSNPIPDFDFMEQEVTSRADEYDKTIICMHARPGSEQFNNNVAKVFQLYVWQFPNVLFCTNAHDHCISVDDIFNDGIIYYGSDCMKHRNYLVFTIKPEGYDYEVVYY
ncbi:metallophosphoesterase family protein [Bacteroides sp.]